MALKVKIRYNHNVGDTGLYWRILINDVEYLASDIDVKVNTWTTGDIVPEVGVKHHISCEPDSIRWIGTKVILLSDSKKVSRIRHLFKTITWRIVGTIDTVMVSWIVTDSIKVGLGIGGFEVFTKMILYYLHERVWFKFNFGKKTKKEKLFCENFNDLKNK